MTELQPAPHIVVAALYHFTRLPDYRELRPVLLRLCREQGIKGTLLLAAEGINGTIAGSREGIDTVLDFLHADERFVAMEHKESFVNAMPFYRMKVKLKNEIVTMGVPDTDPARITGTYLDAEQWNELIQDPDVLVIDTRNDYEVEVGRFQNALSPNTRSFREFPDYVQRELADKKDKKIAMYCTGGIRCEKSTSYLKSQGFEEVFHLKGGILKYLETVKPEDNLWEGECFVFDHRVAVDKNLQPGEHLLCHACRRPVSPEDQQSPDFVVGVSCPQCVHEFDDERRARFAERQRQVELARQRGDEHIGKLQPGTQRNNGDES